MKYNIFIISIFITLLCACHEAGSDIESAFDDHVYDDANITVETNNSIDVSMYDQARIFPGLIDTALTVRTDTTVVIDQSRRYISASQLNLAFVPEAIYSTGLYAGAGELITFIINDNVQGLSVQIGSQMDDLSALAVPMRTAKIYSSKALFPGINTFRNPLGGLIWIRKSGDATGSPDFSIAINGAYRAPDFIINHTDPAAWENEIKTTTVPWLELRSKHFAMTVPRVRMENKIMEDSKFAPALNATLALWDRYFEIIYDFYGLNYLSDNELMRMPDYAERIVLDVQLENNINMYNRTNSIAAVNSLAAIKEMTDYETVASGGFVALDKMFAARYTSKTKTWESDWTGVLPLLPLYLFVEECFKNGATPEMNPIFTSNESDGVVNQFPVGADYAFSSDSIKGFGVDAVTRSYTNAKRLLILLQIRHISLNGKTGGDFFQYINNLARTRNYILTVSLYNEMCRFFEANFAPFFDHWGLSISDAERAACADKYPVIDKSWWGYNPLADNPDLNVVAYTPTETDRYIRYDRSGWEIASKAYFINNNGQRSWLDNYDGTSTPNLLLDNNKTSYWHSNQLTNQNSRPQLPYYILIDCRQNITADGVYAALGLGNNRRVGHFMVQTTTETEISITGESNDMWTIDLLDSDDAGFQKDKNNEQFLKFDGTRQFRYLRIVIDRESHADDPNDLNYNRRQLMSEFGTFYIK